MVDEKIMKIRFARLLLKEQLGETVGHKIKDDYIKEIEVGTLIAFNCSNGNLISGKLIQIMNVKPPIDKSYIIESIDGETHIVTKESIAWVKTGQRWPRQIFEQLKKNGGK